MLELSFKDVKATIITILFFLIFIFVRERDRQTECELGRGREKETQNLKQAPGCELSAQSLTQGSNSQPARSWPELKSDALPTKPSRLPQAKPF